MIDWKNVEKDGLPKKSGEYLTCDTEGVFTVLDYSEKYHLWNSWDQFDAELAKKHAIYNITHWAEINLPET